MILKVGFSESEQNFSTQFKETERNLDVSFVGVQIVERTGIPKEYGLVTYDQNKTITVS